MQAFAKRDLKAAAKNELIQRASAPIINIDLTSDDAAAKKIKPHVIIQSITASGLFLNIPMINSCLHQM